jgi:cysteine desulfurase/selenocysteine lyase
LRLVGRPHKRAAAISFVLDGIHPHDIGTILDRYGIAIRAGHHCAQPAMKRMGVPGTARISLAFYNKREEIDYLVSCLGQVQKVFQP